MVTVSSSYWRGPNNTVDDSRHRYDGHSHDHHRHHSHDDDRHRHQEQPPQRPSSPARASRGLSEPRRFGRYDDATGARWNGHRYDDRRRYDDDDNRLRTPGHQQHSPPRFSHDAEQDRRPLARAYSPAYNRHDHTEDTRRSPWRRSPSRIRELDRDNHLDTCHILRKRAIDLDQYRQDLEDGRTHASRSLRGRIPVPLRPGQTFRDYELHFRMWLAQRRLQLEDLHREPHLERRHWIAFAEHCARTSSTAHESNGSPVKRPRGYCEVDREGDERGRSRACRDSVSSARSSDLRPSSSRPSDGGSASMSPTKDHPRVHRPHSAASFPPSRSLYQERGKSMDPIRSIKRCGPVTRTKPVDPRLRLRGKSVDRCRLSECHSPAPRQPSLDQVDPQIRQRARSVDLSCEASTVEDPPTYSTLRPRDLCESEPRDDVDSGPEADGSDAGVVNEGLSTSTDEGTTNDPPPSPSVAEQDLESRATSKSQTMPGSKSEQIPLSPQAPEQTISTTTINHDESRPTEAELCLGCVPSPSPQDALDPAEEHQGELSVVDEARCNPSVPKHPLSSHNVHTQEISDCPTSPRSNGSAPNARVSPMLYNLPSRCTVRMPTKGSAVSAVVAAYVACGCRPCLLQCAICMADHIATLETAIQPKVTPSLDPMSPTSVSAVADLTQYFDTSSQGSSKASPCRITKLVLSPPPLEKMLRPSDMCLRLITEDPIERRLEDTYDEVNERVVTNALALRALTLQLQEDPMTDIDEARRLQDENEELETLIVDEMNRRNTALALLVMYMWRKSPGELEKLLKSKDAKDVAQVQLSCHCRCAQLAMQLSTKRNALAEQRTVLDSHLASLSGNQEVAATAATEAETVAEDTRLATLAKLSEGLAKLEGEIGGLVALRRREFRTLIQFDSHLRQLLRALVDQVADTQTR